MVQKYKNYPKYFGIYVRICTFAPAFRRNRWREVTSCPSMLRWNDTTNLKIYKKNGSN